MEKVKKNYTSAVRLQHPKFEIQNVTLPIEPIMDYKNKNRLGFFERPF